MLDPLGHLVPQERPQVAMPLRRIGVEDEIGCGRRRGQRGPRKLSAAVSGRTLIGELVVNACRAAACSRIEDRPELESLARENPSPSTRGTGTSGGVKVPIDLAMRKGLGTAARSRAAHAAQDKRSKFGGDDLGQVCRVRPGCRDLMAGLVASVPRGTE